MTATGKRRPRLTTLAAALALLALGAAAAVVLPRRPAPEVRYQPLTFRRGAISGARFTPDGQTVVYSAAWGGGKRSLWMARVDGTESRPLGIDGADILAVSRSGELLIVLGPNQRGGTLARVPLSGGSPRPLQEHVNWATWGPDGESLVLIRGAGGRSQLEYPPGKVLHQSAGWLSEPELSPDGRRLAFFEHPVDIDDRGMPMVVDLGGGAARPLAPTYSSAVGIVWSPKGDEVWFSASAAGTRRSVYAVRPDGSGLRSVARAPTGIVVCDARRDGRVLLLSGVPGADLTVSLAGAAEKDLSWLDFTYLSELSPDGRQILFDEEGEGGGPSYSVYLRETSGAPAVRLGRGRAMALSPDGRSVLVGDYGPPSRLLVLPVGAGDPRILDPGPLQQYHNAAWLPDGRRILVQGSEEGHGSRIYLQDLAGGPPRPLFAEGLVMINRPVSPDGRRLLARDVEGRLQALSLDGSGAATDIPGLKPREGTVAGWNAAGTAIFIYDRAGGFPTHVELLDIATGARTPWRDIAPVDPAGATALSRLTMTPDGASYGYSLTRSLDTLYLAEGLR